MEAIGHIPGTIADATAEPEPCRLADPCPIKWCESSIVRGGYFKRATSMIRCSEGARSKGASKKDHGPRRLIVRDDQLSQKLPPPARVRPMLV
jgi:hypothetical protein